MKSILINPYLLGAQGFIAGALLLWTIPLDRPQPPQPDAEVQLVPPVS